MIATYEKKNTLDKALNLLALSLDLLLALSLMRLLLSRFKVEKKALQALGVLEAKEDWGRMISEGSWWWAHRRWVCAGGLKGIWVDGGPELCFRASKGCSDGISSFSPQETIVNVCSLDSRDFGTLVMYESRTLPDKQDGASFQPYSINFAFIHVPMLVLFRKPNHDKVALCNN
ncbi:hypothetical protein NC652_005381 [Populus alba x Populus x berolinensis]|nr:hypothetical protein NC652_005381 [Populus alba x Populus x berolinensis]